MAEPEPEPEPEPAAAGLGAGYRRAKELWALAHWDGQEAARNERTHAAMDELDAALDAAAGGGAPRSQRAAGHNLRGQCYETLGQLAEARADYRRALKLNGGMEQARTRLAGVEAALAAREAARGSARARQRQQRYCCGCVPRCKRGPWKPQKVRPAPPRRPTARRPVTRNASVGPGGQEDFGGPAFAKLQRKTHLVSQLSSMAPVVVGDGGGAPAPPAAPPQISWAWPQSPRKEVSVATPATQQRTQLRPARRVGAVRREGCGRSPDPARNPVQPIYGLNESAFGARLGSAAARASHAARNGCGSPRSSEIPILEPSKHV